VTPDKMVPFSSRRRHRLHSREVPEVMEGLRLSLLGHLESRKSLFRAITWHLFREYLVNGISPTPMDRRITNGGVEGGEIAPRFYQDKLGLLDPPEFVQRKIAEGRIPVVKALAYRGSDLVWSCCGKRLAEEFGDG